ncbi:MAG: hypothetical protein M1828_001605 [Chrysothrix sp. TS-e1954]|nr:MAG: hypothetical protein M1828_001605 [Chrysothrix sp. TS-e1954]
MDYFPSFSRDELRAKDTWIRDILEPQIAERGKDVLDPDTTLEINEFLVKLLRSSITYDDLKATRIHRSILLMSKRQTRWPPRIIKMCDEILKIWNNEFGPLQSIHTPLYEPGARLHGIAGAAEHNRKELVEKWHGSPNKLVCAERAMEHGSLEFEPGQWWIHPIFAYHAGIISYTSAGIGITADEESAYAVLMTEQDEVVGGRFDRLQYQVKEDDPNCHRLRGCILPMKTPVRVLRSHTLNSEWRPSAGVRYDGLQVDPGFVQYLVIGWSAWLEGHKKWVFQFELEREKGQASRAEILSRPTSEEIDDYLKYRRTRSAYEQEKVDVSYAEAEILPTLELSEDANILPIADALDTLVAADMCSSVDSEEISIASDDKITVDEMREDPTLLPDITDERQTGTVGLSSQLHPYPPIALRKPARPPSRPQTSRHSSYAHKSSLEHTQDHPKIAVF